MCGLFGVLASHGSDGSVLDGRRFVASLATIERRGPDDVGVALFDRTGRHVASADFDPDRRSEVVHGDLGGGWDLALGHRRLSIIDLSPTGHQPMTSPGTRSWMVYNGELYNYIELREELQREGREFLTPSDAEVVLQAYLHWGTECFRRFIGMWAIAIVDLERNVMVLSRDPFGIKPLYLWHRPGELMFASDPRPLLHHAGAGVAKVDSATVSAYLRTGDLPADDRSFIEGMRQLDAGSTVEVPIGDPARSRVVQRRDDRPSELIDITPADAAERLRELFLQSVRLHLRADVPVGAALSGGIDSSGIVAAMRRVAGPDLDLRTFSYSADDPIIDEARYQNIVAAAVDAHHHVVRIDAADFAADLDDLIRAQVEPFRGPSVYAQYRVFKSAREGGVTVMLDGQGADELFAGYIPFVAVRIAALLRRGHLSRAARLLKVSRQMCRTPGNSIAMEKYVIDRIAPQSVANLARRRRHGVVAGSWIQPSLSVDHSGFGRPRLRDGVRAEAALETWRTSLPELLRYEDRNSMAHSLESRVPFLTTTMSDFALSLPDHVLIDDAGRTKAVVRDAFEGLVPTEVLARRDKIGFQPPDDRWFAAAGDWVDATLTDCTPPVGAGIDIAALRQRVLESRAAGRSGLDSATFRTLVTLRWATLHGVE